MANSNVNSPSVGFGAGRASESWRTTGESAVTGADEPDTGWLAAAARGYTRTQLLDSSLRVPVYGQPAPSAPCVFMTCPVSMYSVSCPAIVTFTTGFAEDTAVTHRFGLQS